jgi:PAS domain S-box-containing protein
MQPSGVPRFSPLILGILELSSDAIAVSSLDTGHFVHANDAFLRLHGYSRDEVIGRLTAKCCSTVTHRATLSICK